MVRTDYQCASFDPFLGVGLKRMQLCVIVYYTQSITNRREEGLISSSIVDKSNRMAILWGSRAIIPAIRSAFDETIPTEIPVRTEKYELDSCSNIFVYFMVLLEWIKRPIIILVTFPPFRFLRSVTNDRFVAFPPQFGPISFLSISATHPIESENCVWLE